MKFGRAVASVLCLGLATVSAGQTPNLPPRDAFLRDAREALARSQAAWYRYAYKERRTELHLNPFGRMGTGGTRLLDVQPGADRRSRCVRVIERNGMAVPRSELERQDAECRERARDAQNAGDAADRQHNDDLLAQRRAQMMVEDVVNTLQFELVRREYRNGKPVIVVEFSARPEARPVTREGRVARVFRGHLWFDESSRELIEVKARAVDDVSFGGFIAKIYEGTEATIVRREVDPGVWLPTRVSLTGEVRALFRKAHIEHVVEWFDYHAVR